MGSLLYMLAIISLQLVFNILVGSHHVDAGEDMRSWTKGTCVGAI